MPCSKLSAADYAFEDNETASIQYTLYDVLVVKAEAAKSKRTLRKKDSTIASGLRHAPQPR